MFKIYKLIVLGICLILQSQQFAYAAESDEIACDAGQFQCNDGECINADLKCNLAIDCKDQSDETFEHCYGSKCSERRCSYGACFEHTQFCDGKRDCWDGTDEHQLSCANQTKIDEIEELMDNQIRGECRDKAFTEFQCKRSKECISYSLVCDGTEHCRDKSDESDELCVGSFCPEGSFRCGYGACIAKSAACNHVIDCRDESDEMASICNENTPGGNWEISRWKITAAIDTQSPILSAPVPTETVGTAQTVAAQQKSCIVPTEDKALRLKIMYNGVPYSYGNDVSHLTTVGFECSKMHVLRGTKINTCDNGKWKAAWPQCIKLCDKSKVTNDPKITAVCSYNNKIIDCDKDPLVVNTIAEVTCEQGYVPEGITTKAERICNNKGQWVRRDDKSPKLKCKPDCGKKFETVEGDPWLVSIYHHIANNNYGFSCLGTIIDPFSVLTTVSCFPANPDPHATLVVMGNHSIAFNEKKEHGFTIAYIERINVKDLKPLALLRMVNPFKLSASVRPICMSDSTCAASKKTVINWRARGEPSTDFDVEKQASFPSHTLDAASDESFESLKDLGEPITGFDAEKQAFFLSQIVDGNKTIGIMQNNRKKIISC